MKRLSLLLCVTFLFCVATVHAVPNTAVLDGKTFAGEMTKKGDKKGDPDNFVFKEGGFTSTGCTQYGFKENAPYKVSKVKKGTAFEVTTMNDKGSKISWRGNITGNTVQGKAVMMTKAGEKTHFSFHGTAQN